MTSGNLLGLDGGDVLLGEIPVDDVEIIHHNTVLIEFLVQIVVEQYAHVRSAADELLRGIICGYLLENLVDGRHDQHVLVTKANLLVDIRAGGLVDVVIDRNDGGYRLKILAECLGGYFCFHNAVIDGYDLLRERNLEMDSFL